MKKPFLSTAALRTASTFILSGTLLLAGCSEKKSTEQTTGETNAQAKLVGDPDNGGIKLTDGFSAVVVADNLGKARHLTVHQNGDVYVALENTEKGGGIVALRDTSGDGRADITERFGEFAGTGIDIHNGYLYFSPDSAVLRYKLRAGELTPEKRYETIAHSLTSRKQHASKPFVFDGQGNMYVTIGAPSNACQEPDRQPGVPGQDPCPILEYAGGIWRFKADQPNQTQQDGTRYATGIRNAVALFWNTTNSNLYALQHGRDQLAAFWPKRYEVTKSAELPSEEFMLVKEGSNFGWPYCYNDHIQNKKVLNPEYGGDGNKTARCDSMDKPIMAFPGHWAPNDLLFYTGNMLPEKYKNGAFIAFHGSWNRAPLKQGGYFVAFVPFEGEKPSGNWEVFAEGFAGTDSLSNPSDAKFRPMGLAQGPDGSLYISDSQKGRIWRVLYNNKAVASRNQPTTVAMTEKK